MNWTLLVLVVGAVALVALTIGRYGRRIEARIGAMHLTVEDVNKAVNHKPPDAPSLYQHAADAATAAKEARSVACEVRDGLNSHLAWHQTKEQATR